MADQLERLTNLIALLLETRVPLTLDRIAHELVGQYPDDAVARRGAFERDKALLRAEGIPLELTTTADGGTAYRIERSRYELGDLGLTDDERQALQLAVAAIHLGVAWGDDALRKLGGDDVGSDAAGPDVVGPVASLPSLPALPTLFEANGVRASVSFRYRGRDRVFDPWGLAAREGFWYLIGRDHERGEQRTFRVDRIEGEVVVGESGTFEPPAGFDPVGALFGDAKTMLGGELVEATVAVDAVRATRAVDELGEAAVRERRADGSVVVVVASTNPPAFRSWVLGLLEHAEVLGPPTARAELVDWLEQVAAGPSGPPTNVVLPAPVTKSAASGRGPRPTHERLRRLLVMLPWLMARGEVAVADMAERFGISEAHLIADLERASMCGLPPYVDELVDLYIDDGIIYAGVPRLFTRPLRLSASEGFSLLVAGRAALELPGAEPDGPLARALDKLERELGSRPSVAVALDHPAHLDAVQRAVEAGERLAVVYYSARRDERTHRSIDPHAVFSDRGDWYVIADDSASGEQRTFRIDRIEDVHPTGETFVRRDVAVPVEGFFADSDLPEVTLLLPADATWVAERYPVRATAPQADGRLVAVLAVSGDRWLERLLLRAGPHAQVLSPATWVDSAARAAQRVLARYR